MLELDSIITNGYVDIQTIEHFTARGYVFVCTVPAKSAHPHAAITDKLSVFAKYTSPSIDNNCSEGTLKMD